MFFGDWVGGVEHGWRYLLRAVFLFPCLFNVMVVLLVPNHTENVFGVYTFHVSCRTLRRRVIRCIETFVLLIPSRYLHLVPRGSSDSIFVKSFHLHRSSVYPTPQL